MLNKDCKSLYRKDFVKMHKIDIFIFEVLFNIKNIKLKSYFLTRIGIYIEKVFIESDTEADEKYDAKSS